LSVDHRHLNDHTKKDKMPLPIMEKLKQWLSGADYITKVDMQAGFHLMPMALGHENFTAFRTKFGLYEYMLMPFRLTNAPATLPGEINRMI